MANSFKKVIDRLMWVQVAPAPNAHAAGGRLCADMRNSVARNPFVYQLVSNTGLNRFNIITKGWGLLPSPALAGTFGAGAGCVFAPSLGLTGSLGAGCTTTSIVTTTPMTAVGANMLANRGGSGEYGFQVRIIGKSGGGSGKVEERWIIGNSAGTTPTLLLGSALSFTPAAGDTYEILGGRLFMLGSGTTASNSWRSWEVASNLLSSGLSTTGLPATISTDFAAVALDETYVPYDAKPGEGFVTGVGTYGGGALKCLVATASGAGSLTGQASGGDATVLANEYRNFQIRVVEDTGTPTAVGQRRIIASHTAGVSPVYTLGANWSVTPSSGAKFVIEYPNLILLRSTATATIYAYNYGVDAYNNGTANVAANAWSTTVFGNAGGVMGAGAVVLTAHGIRPDASKAARHSHVFMFRGGNTSTLDVLDIAGGVAGTWDNAAVYDGTLTLNTGSAGANSPFGNEGRMGYVTQYTASQISQVFRFDVQNRVMSPMTPTDFIQSGTAAAGGRVAAYCAIDGTDLYDVVLLLSHVSTVAQELLVLV